MNAFRQPQIAPANGASIGGAGDNTTDLPEDARAIGDIIREAKNLSADQVEQILHYQREKGMRFGEAAVALGMANSNDVLWALSQQFHYPYAPESQDGLSKELVVATEPFSQKAEAFRAIRSQLMMRLYGPDKPRKALAVVSPDSGDGRTYFAANLAVAFAQLGGRTLLIDADLRNPRLQEIFRLRNTEAGLSRVLSGQSATNVIKPLPDVPSLFLLPVGTAPPNPLELVERPAFGLLMRELIHKFDYIIVDTPAASYGTDCAVIAAKCGASLILAKQDSTKLQAVHAVLASLEMAGVAQAGVVINEA